MKEIQLTDTEHTALLIAVNRGVSFIEDVMCSDDDDEINDRDSYETIVRVREKLANASKKCSRKALYDEGYANGYSAGQAFVFAGLDRDGN